MHSVIGFIRNNLKCLAKMHGNGFQNLEKKLGLTQSSISATGQAMPQAVRCLGQVSLCLTCMLLP